MITLEDVTIEYPSRYQFEYKPVKGKHLILGGGYVRRNINSKHQINISWKFLTREQYEELMDIFEAQFTTFEPVTFVFSNARIGGDMGPIDFFMKLENNKRTDYNRYEVSITLYQV